MASTLISALVAGSAAGSGGCEGCDAALGPAQTPGTDRDGILPEKADGMQGGRGRKSHVVRVRFPNF